MKMFCKQYILRVSGLLKVNLLIIIIMLLYYLSNYKEVGIKVREEVYKLKA